MDHRLRACLVIGVLLATGFVGTSYYHAATREIWLVNGLDVPYRVTIDGDSRTLAPRIATRVKTGEGRLEIVPELPGLQALSIDVTTPFFSRPFNQPAFVINPDQVAVLLWQEVVYQENPTDQGQYEIHVGATSYVFDDIDYPFETIPESLLMEDGKEYREGLSLMTQSNTWPEVLGSVMADLGTPAAADLVTRRLSLGSVRDDDVYFAAMVLPTDEFVALVRPHLNERPFRIDWHRSYQDVIRESEQSVDLVAEYRAVVDSDSASAAAHYLLGRVVDDAAESDAIFRHSSELDPALPYPHYARAYDALCRGEFERAKRAVNAVVQAQGSEADSFRSIRASVFWANGAWVELEQMLSLSLEPENSGMVRELVCLLGTTGRISEAEELIRFHANALRRKQYSQSEIWAIRDMLAGDLAMANGDIDALYRIVDESPQSGWTSDVAMLQGRLQDAAALLKQTNNTVGTEHVLLAALAANAGDTTLAQSELALALDSFREDSLPWRRLAVWIETATPPSMETVRSMSLLPTDKRVALIALAVAFPERRPELWELARIMNVYRAWPYFTIRTILDES